MRLLLISNSTLHGSGYLDHCAEAIVSFLGPSITRVLFVPYAVHDRDAYTVKARERFERMGLALDSIHEPSSSRETASPERAAGLPESASRRVENAQSLFIGGGNTFRLVNALWKEGLVEPIRRRVRAGMPYVGSSAGSNVACPTIKTTNDMPIVQPPTFEALDLVPLQINPHYQDPIPGSTHMGETREERIAEFHEENDVPVVGLREGAWLLVDGSAVTLQGSTGARIFRRGVAPHEFPVGSGWTF